MGSSRGAKRKTCILIADREGIFRLGLKKLLSLEDDLRVVAQAETAPQTLALANTFKPEVAFIQAEILSEDSTRLVPAIQGASPKCRVVVMTSSTAEEDGVRYVQDGAAGVILKSADPKLFVKCARKVREGEVWLPKRQVAEMAKQLGEKPPVQTVRPVDTLTRKEKIVISYLMQGWRNREIAQALTITEQTVKNHLRTIYDKVGVSDRLELVLYVIHQRLEIPPVESAVSAGA